MDLTFQVQAKWAGVARTGEGAVSMGSQSVAVSAPASMGGKGIGASPEDLLLAAVTACYSGTLMRVLREAGLPGDAVSVATEGVVQDFPAAPRFSGIVVNPVIHHGIPGRAREYEAAAQTARDRCFIGRTVRDHLDYRVGTVRVE